MRQRGVGEESRCVKNVEFIYAEGQNLFLDTFQLLSSGNSFQLATQLRGQFTAFSQQLQADVSHGGAFYFKIYKYVIHFHTFFGLAAPLTDGVVGQQFHNQSFYIGIATAECFALFGLEDDVFNLLHLGG